MAVLVSAGATKLTETNLSDVNGFYTSYAYNFEPGTGSAGFGSDPSTNGFVIPLTFASNHNVKGVVMPLTCATSSNDRNVEIRLEETMWAVTISNANPAVLTKIGHGFVGGERISLATTGALPAGLTVSRMYWVSATGLTADTFSVSATDGGARIATTNAGSGTHTLWLARAYNDSTPTDLSVPTTASYGDWIFDFPFNTVYAVDTTASKWRLNLRYVGGTTGSWYYRLSVAAGTPCYVTYNDTANATFSDGNDVIVARNITVCNSAHTIAGIYGTGASTYLHGIICCSNRSATVAESMLFRIREGAAAYTFTFNGSIVQPTWGGVSMGDDTPITKAKRVTITSPAGIIIKTGGTHSQSTNGHGKFCSAWNGVYADAFDTVAADAAAGQKVVVTTLDHSATWAAGDEIIIGKRNSIGTDNVRYVIDTIVGTTVTLLANISASRPILGPHTDANGSVFPGATICNLSQYGIKITTSGTTGQTYGMSTPVHCQIHGVYFYDVIAYFANINLYDWWTDPYEVEHSITDCAMVKNTANYLNAFITGYTVPKPGLEVKRIVTQNMSLIYGIYPVYSLLWNSGAIEFDDCHMLFVGGNQFNTAAVTTLPKLTVTNCSWEQSGATMADFSSQSATIEDNFFWQCTYSTNPTGAALFNKVINPVSIARNLYSACYIGWASYAGQNTKAVDVGSKFDATYNNTTDIYVGSYGLLDYRFDSPVGIQTISTINQPTSTPGSNLRFAPYSGTVDDRMYLVNGEIQRCGTGLTDTTVHTSGSGKYSLRMKPLSSTLRLEWVQTIPTGNIQTKTMQVGVWVNINNAAYYAGTNQLPRLTINYDNGTTAYAQATAATGWQYLSVPFTPTTTYGSITATISGMTDAAGTNAYIYWDDFSVLYPAGYIMDASGLDLWSNAEPVMPTISTLFSAMDFWNAQTSTLTGTGTIGKLINTMYQLLAYIGFVKK